MSNRQAKVGQGNHRLDRVAAGGEGVVLGQRRVVADTRVVGVNAVGLAVAPAELDDQVHAKRLGQAGGVALVGVVLEAGGHIIVGVEKPMVVVAILHPLGGFFHRRGGGAVNGHPQEQVTTLHDGLKVPDVAAGVGHVLGVAHLGQAGKADTLEGQFLGLDPVDGPAITRTFLKG